MEDPFNDMPTAGALVAIVDAAGQFMKQYPRRVPCVCCAGRAWRSRRPQILPCAFLIREVHAQTGDLHPRVQNVRSGERAMEEDNLSNPESPDGIPEPAATAEPVRSGSVFVYITFLPSPFGPGYEAGIRGWEGNYDPADGWADGGY